MCEFGRDMHASVGDVCVCVCESVGGGRGVCKCGRGVCVSVRGVCECVGDVQQVWERCV